MEGLDCPIKLLKGPPMFGCCCVQVLASGSCINGDTCGIGKSPAGCRAVTTGSTTYTPDRALASGFFSSTYKEFGVGTHTVLLRIHR